MKFVYTFFNSFLRTLARIICYLLVGMLLCVILSKMGFKLFSDVYAETQNLSVAYVKGYVYGTGSLVWNTQNNTNTSAHFDYNNGLGMGISLRLLGLIEDGTNIGKYIKINYTTCISGGTPLAQGFNGYSSAGNVTGDFTYYKDGKLGKQGSCTVGGQTGVLSTNYIIFTIKSETIVDQNTSTSEGTLTMWNGATANTAGYATFNAISITEYNPTDNSNTIINQNDTIINNQNDIKQGVDNIDSTLKDESSPNLDALDNTAGWLPAGPLDSVLNLPLSLLNNLTTNMNKTCKPVSLPLPFLDDTLQLPCINSIYSQIEGLSVWINSVSVIAVAFILFHYLMGLYKWVDDTLTFRENNWIDNWTGV